MMMYEFRYTAIFEEPPAPLPSRSRLISNAIELLEASSRPAFQPFEQLQLLSDSRRLWRLIADGVRRAPKELPKTQQARFLADVLSVLQEIERRRFNPPVQSAARPAIPPEPRS
jgi:flagellar biosynthesis regulator FlaF